MPTLRGAIWAAVSSEEQIKGDKDSVPTQLRMGNEHAGRHGVNVVAELVVPGQSRSITRFDHAAKEIGAYAQLEQLLDSKSIDVLFFMGADRLGRTLGLVSTVQGMCDDAGVALYDMKNPPSRIERSKRTTTDIMVGAFHGVMAQGEIAELKRRHTFGMQARTKAGKLPSGPAWGYKREGGEIVPDPETAPWVQKIFTWYCEGYGGETICKWLNDAGVRRPGGGIFITGPLYAMLNRVWLYAGYAEFNRKAPLGGEYVRAKGKHTPLITEEMAYLVESERAARRQNRHLADDPYELSGVVQCGVCGKMMNVHNTSRKDGPPRLQLKCQRSPFQSYAHPGASASYRMVMQALFDFCDALAKEDDFGEFSDENATPALVAQQEAHMSSLRNLMQSLTKADTEYVMGRWEESRYRAVAQQIQERIEGEQGAIAALEQRIAHERSRGSYRKRVEQVAREGRQKLEAGGLECNRWLRQMIRVKVEHGEIKDIYVI